MTTGKLIELLKQFDQTGKLPVQIISESATGSPESECYRVSITSEAVSKSCRVILYSRQIIKRERRKKEKLPSRDYTGHRHKFEIELGSLYCKKCGKIEPHLIHEV